MGSPRKLQGAPALLASHTIGYWEEALAPPARSAPFRAGGAERLSQRELVVASLLRRPEAEPLAGSRSRALLR